MVLIKKKGVQLIIFFFHSLGPIDKPHPSSPFTFALMEISSPEHLSFVAGPAATPLRTGGIRPTRDEFKFEIPSDGVDRDSGGESGCRARAGSEILSLCLSQGPAEKFRAPPQV